MRKNEFIEYIRSPETLNCDKTSELQKLTTEFPWFQSAQILLCRNLKVCENMGFEEQLRLTAAYAGDRVRLHQLIMETAQVAGKEKTLTQVSTETNEKNSLIQENAEEEKISNNEEIKTSDQAVKKASLAKKLASQKTDEHPEEDLLNKQILSHAISNSDLLDGIENAEEIPEHIHLEKNSLREENEQEFPVEELHEKDEEFNTNEEFNENTEHSFSDWLHHFEDPKEKTEIEFLIAEDKKNLLLPSQTKTNFYSPIEMAKLSVKEDDDLITETLAKIYAQQGNIEKAIKSYNKLSLKYPEKKVYFASQIRELEKQL